MGNREARELMLRQEEERSWERITTEPRPALRDIHAIGIGTLRLQLMVFPSFNDAQAWEIREGPNEWRLFSPRVFSSYPEIQLVGYDQVVFPAKQLSTYFDRIISLTLPLQPDLSGCGGADGTSYQLAVFGDLYSSWRFQWWSESPEQWRPLVDITAEMIKAFSSSNNPPSPC